MPESESLPGSGSFICLESKAFYALFEHVVEKLRKEFQIKDKWLSEKEAMERLHIKSKTTLQKLRDEGLIDISQPLKKLILYDAESIDKYLTMNSTKWVSENDGMKMLGIKSSTDIRKLAQQNKIKTKEINPNNFVYSVRSIQNYLEESK